MVTGSSPMICENGFEVLLLHRQKFRQGAPAARFVVGENHLAHRLNAITLKKHMLGAAKTNPFTTKCLGNLGLVGLVGIGAHAQGAHFIGPTHQFGESLIDPGFSYLQRFGNLKPAALRKAELEFHL